MKINVVYQVDVEKLPHEIRDRLRSLHGEFQQAPEAISEICQKLENRQVPIALELLEGFKSKLEEVYRTIDQYSVILAQYLGTIASMHMPKEENPVASKEDVARVAQQIPPKQRSQLMPDIGDGYLSHEDPTPDLSPIKAEDLMDNEHNEGDKNA